MKRAKLRLKCFVNGRGQFENRETLFACLKLAVPKIDRFNLWNDVCAGGEMFSHQFARDPARCFAVRKRAQGEQNLLGHR